MDVNKIIMESIQDVIGDKTEPVIEDKVESVIEDKVEPIITEGIGEVVDSADTDDTGENYSSIMRTAKASSIAAGLGALSLRKKLSSLNESKK